MSKSQTEVIEEFQAEAGKAFFETYRAKAKPVNPTGMHPVEFKCLIRLDPTPKKVGNIHLPDEDQDRRQQAETFATLIECGSRAFEDFGALKPMPGDRVLVNAYSAAPAKKGDFESLFRFCNDKDVIAVIDE